MPKREPIFSREDTAAQDRHRPDQPPEPTPEPDEPAQAETAKKQTKRDTQDQINVLIDGGLAHPFKMKAWGEHTTMSDLVNQWVKEYLAGKR